MGVYFGCHCLCFYSVPRGGSQSGGDSSNSGVIANHEFDGNYEFQGNDGSNAILATSVLNVAIAIRHLCNAWNETSYVCSVMTVFHVIHVTTVIHVCTPCVLGLGACTNVRRHVRVGACPDTHAWAHTLIRTLTYQVPRASSCWAHA